MMACDVCGEMMPDGGSHQQPEDCVEYLLSANVMHRKRAKALKTEVERLTAVNGTLLAACEKALKHIQGQWREVGNHPAHHLADYVSELAEVIAKARGE